MEESFRCRRDPPKDLLVVPRGLSRYPPAGLQKILLSITMSGQKPPLVSIGQFHFEPDLTRLTTSVGEEVHLEPKHAQALALLVEMRGETVSWPQFKEHLWSELSIDDEELPKRVSTCIHYLREKLGRDGHLIVSHAGRGYELVAERHTFASVAEVPADRQSGNAICLSTITSRTMFHLNAALALGRGRYQGWSHYFYDRNITAIGSAYGLRIARLAALGQPASAVQYSKVVDGLLARRRQGLWIGAAGQGPLEATAWALRGLSGWVRLDDIAESVEALEEAAGEDEMLAVRVNSLSLAVAVLAMVSPQSKVLGRLALRLQNCCETPDALQYWRQEVGSEQAAVKGSPVHTAHAALALLEAHTATGGRVGCDRADLQGVREWLLKQNWDNGSETISRGKRPRPLTVNHYTSPWVVQALLRLGEPPTNNRIRRTVRQIVADQSDGLWPWGNGIQKPLWATHDALTALVEWLRSMELVDFPTAEAPTNA